MKKTFTSHPKRMLSCRVPIPQRIYTALRRSVLTLMLLCVSLLAVAQSNTVSVTAVNQPVSSVLKSIEKQSGFTFFYNNNVIDVNRKVTVKALNKEVMAVLKEIFAGSDVGFSIMGKSIVLSVASAAEKQPANEPTKRFSGVILDENGSPVVGATITSETDNMVATSSDINGHFSLDVANGSVVKISYVGYTTTTAVVNKGAKLQSIVLKEDNKLLDEVIVVGYGTQRRSDVTGAISSVSSEKLNNTPTSSFAEMLRGAAPGIHVSLGSAEPGGTSSILIRGRRSLSGGNTPLYIVDGVPMSNIDDVNASDIASVEVLKDASSQSIYGARAANGVILVTTKRGVAGKVRVNYSGYIAVQDIKRNFEFYNGEEFAAFRHEAYYNANGYYDEEDCFRGLMLDVMKSGEYVDWEKAMISTALQTKHDVSIQAGNDKTKFSLGLGYYNQDGMVPSSSFDKVSGRLNIDQKLGKKVSVGANISYMRSWKKSSDGSFNTFVTMPPLAKIYNEDGSLREDVTEAGESHYNPLWNIRNSEIEAKQNHLVLNLFGDWKICRDLSYRVNASMSTRTVDSGNYLGIKHTTGKNTDGKATVSNSVSADYLIENILNYNKDIDKKHHIDATLMQSINVITWNKSGQTGTGFPNDDLSYNAIGSALEYGIPTWEVSKRKIVSFMGRVRYSYAQKYLFTLSMRIDGSSVFGKNNKFGYFPSAAFAWRANEENFLKDVRWLSNLKLRLSYGQVGNQGIAPYTTLGLVEQYLSEFGGNQTVGYIPSSTLWNPNLKWETSTSTNVGLDFGFLKGRINGSIEWYDTQTTDLLIVKALNQSLGYTGQMVNLGQVQNRGVEVMINTTPVQTKKVRWDLGFSFSKNVNKIKKIDGERNADGSYKNDVNNKWFIGSPINVYYDYRFDGIWQTGDDIANSHMPSAKPGDIRVANTTDDNELTPDDRVIMKCDPDWIGDITTSVSFFGIDISADLYISQGGTMYNPYLTTFANGGDMTGKRNGIRRNYWTTNNPSNEAPRPNMTQAPAYITSLGYQDASFVRLRNVTVGYTFPTKISRKIGMENLNIYTTLTNLWTKTDVLGYGPEQTPGDYPEPRTFLFGVKASF